MLARVGREVTHARQDTSEDDIAVEKFGETWNLTGTGRSYLGLVVFEQSNKSRDEFVANNDVSDGCSKLNMSALVFLCDGKDSRRQTRSRPCSAPASSCQRRSNEGGRAKDP